MKTYSWHYNIRCAIQGGKAMLHEDEKKHVSCRGECHACKSFLGVDPADSGAAFFKGCCAAGSL